MSEQRTHGLELANRARMLKAAVRNGDMAFGQALARPEAGGLRLNALLACVPKPGSYGAHFAQRMLLAAGCWGEQKVRDLAPAERDRLALAVADQQLAWEDDDLMEPAA